MTFQQLRSFLAVAELEHVHWAADRLGMTQPALSRQIRALEAELQVLLFDRVRKRLKLSAAGSALIPEVERILSCAASLRDHAKSLSRGEQNTLRICPSEAAAWLAIVSTVVQAFGALEPRAELSISYMDYPTQLAALDAGAMDVAFAYACLNTQPGLEALPLGSESLLLALPRAHRLASKSSLRLRDLAAEPFVWVSRDRNAPYHDMVMQACLEGGLMPRVVQEASTQATLLSLVALGVGAGFVIESARSRGLVKVHFRQVQDLTLQVPFSLVWRPQNASAILHRFVKFTERYERAKQYGRAGS